MIWHNKSFFENIIVDADLYFAHKLKDTASKEYLAEHASLVLSYCHSLVEKNHLDHTIRTLIEKIVPDIFSNKIAIEDFINQLFIDSIAYHDFGKVNHLFQIEKMGNNNQKLPKVDHDIKFHHSILSAYIFLQHQYEYVRQLKLKDEEQPWLDWLILCFSYPILKHHSASLNELKNDVKQISKSKKLKPYLSFFRLEISDENVDEIHWDVLEKIEDLIDQIDRDFSAYQTEFPLYALLKLCYSLLTASDYLATVHYMNGWSKMYDEFGVLNNGQKERLIRNLKTTKSYNKAVYDNIDTFAMQCPQERNNKNLNRLRSEMAVEIIRNIRKNADKHLFYIEAPTGGGKTNLSMIALAELLEHDLKTGSNNINKVFYVFPFTTLITQTYKVLEETLGLAESEIIELHSKSDFKAAGEDDEYGTNKKCYLDGLFVNYPVVVTSHVRFFDILKTNRKETNYLLHRIANSVVIIDELQSYSPEQWDKLIYLIDNYAEPFNVKFILMSATLPKIGNLTWSEKVPEFVSLIADKNKYFQNENFKGRVKFDFSLLNWSKPSNGNAAQKEAYLQKLNVRLFEESQKYAEKNGQVFTIIEFIFKQTASDFYTIANTTNNQFFNCIFVLSGTILEPRRKEIIEFIKNEKNRNNNILLITTQVVEAGVDIDMDLGFKDKSLIDSDEQLAGRINRNVKKDGCSLFLFDYDDASFIYKTDRRFTVLNPQEYEQILEEKEFDKLYNKVMEDRKDYNKGDQNSGLSDFRYAMQSLNFENVDEAFKLIKGQNYSIFVQLDIPIIIPNTNTSNFSGNELSFLKEHSKFQKDDEYVSGERVWELYTEIIQSKDDDFMEQKIRLKKIQSIMSKFTFSIFAQSKDVKQLIERGYKDDDFGFIRLHDIKDNGEAIYNYYSGLVAKKLEGAILF
jgi:CRISPR-associated endonuclease/helicase Cas3